MSISSQGPLVMQQPGHSNSMWFPLSPTLLSYIPCHNTIQYVSYHLRYLASYTSCSTSTPIPILWINCLTTYLKGPGMHWICVSFSTFGFLTRRHTYRMQEASHTDISVYTLLSWESLTLLKAGTYSDYAVQFHRFNGHIAWRLRSLLLGLSLHCITHFEKI